MTPTGAHDASPAGARPHTALAILPVVLALVVYWPAIGAGFVGDDFMILHRLRQLTGPADVAGFFTAEFFEYYRPAGFVAHALDYALAGSDPRQFHLTNLALHLLNTALVGLIAARLSPHPLAGPLAAVLFGLHASNHEAVAWISARFDLLATTFGLAAVWLMMRDHARSVLPACLFAVALLSKESAVALPLVAAGWAAFGERDTTAGTVRRMAPWVIALLSCAALRQFAGGVSAVGGSGRLPKVVAFALLIGIVLLLAGGRWEQVREWLRARRRLAAVGGTLVVATAATLAAMSSGAAGRLAAEKLAVAGFATFHLLSPWVDLPGVPFYLDARTTRYWAVGATLLALSMAVMLALWHRLLRDHRMWFLATGLIATLLPVSALTEGQRYLYLPSAMLAVIASVLIAEIQRRGRRQVALVIVGLVLATSAVQITRKLGDWRWAGRMTADAAVLVDRALAPACNQGDVVFLTSPVSVRGVYTHFYYETFELPRGCRPGSFQVLARTFRVDTTAEVGWEREDLLSIVVPSYPGTYVLSEDLRQFNRPVHRGAVESIETPLGAVRTEPYGSEGIRLMLSLAVPLVDDAPLFFYYSDGRIHPLPRRGETHAAATGVSAAGPPADRP